MATLSLSRARTIISKAFLAGKDRDLKPLSVAVLDAGGHLKAFERQDGASIARFQIAFGKAYGALALGMGSRAIMARAETQAYFVNAVAGALGGALVPVPGGVLIKAKNGEILGAVGVTGDSSDNDEAAAVAAIEAVGCDAETG
ncbi:MAG: heme-binding protein [Paracoccaceae bacterium]